MENNITMDKSTGITPLGDHFTMGENLKALLHVKTKPSSTPETAHKFTFQVKEQSSEVYVLVLITNSVFMREKTAMIQHVSDEHGNTQLEHPVTYHATTASRYGSTYVIRNMPLGTYEVRAVDKNHYSGYNEECVVLVTMPVYNDRNRLLPEVHIYIPELDCIKLSVRNIFVNSCVVRYEMRKQGDTEWTPISDTFNFTDYTIEYSFRYYLTDLFNPTRIQYSKEFRVGPIFKDHKLLRKILRLNRTPEFLEKESFGFWIDRSSYTDDYSVQICESGCGWTTIPCTSRKYPSPYVIHPCEKPSVNSSFHVRLYMKDKLVYETNEAIDFRRDNSFTSLFMKHNNDSVIFSAGYISDGTTLTLSRYKTFTLNNTYVFSDDDPGYESEYWYGTFRIEPIDQMVSHQSVDSTGVYKLYLHYNYEDYKEEYSEVYTIYKETSSTGKPVYSLHMKKLATFSSQKTLLAEFKHFIIPPLFLSVPTFSRSCDADILCHNSTSGAAFRE